MNAKSVNRARNEKKIFAEIFQNAPRDVKSNVSTTHSSPMSS